MSGKSNRLLRIYGRLKRGPVTIDVIRDWAHRNGIEVSERSLYRDLSEIENSVMLDGERIVVSEGEKNKKTWKIEFRDSGSGLTEFDINSFHLFRNFAPLALVSSRKASLEKAEALFYQQHSRSHFERSAQVANLQVGSTHFYELPYTEGYNQLLQDCIWCLQNQRLMELRTVAYDYTSLSASLQYPLRFQPLQLLYHRGCIHLAGFTLDKKLMVLAVEQVQDYALTNDMFDATALMPLLQLEMEKRFGVSENMNEAVHDMEIEFSEYTGSFVSHHFWHPSQQFSRLPDGNYLLKLRCGINRELVGWIFQWMSNARVLAPLELKTMVEEKLQDITRLYATGGPLLSNNSFKPR